MRETRNYYTTPSNYAEDHTRFGGLIYKGDFETEYYPEHGRNIASRIASDWKFDERCRKNAENRDRAKKLQKGSD